MLGLQYEPRHGIIDSDMWPISRFVPVDIPDYRITKPLDHYGAWPSWYPVYLPVPEFRRYLNNLLLRDMRLRQYNYVHKY